MFELIMTPKCKSRDTGNLNMLNRSHKVLPLPEKVKSLNLMGKMKCGMLSLLRPTAKRDLCETVKEEKKNCSNSCCRTVFDEVPGTELSKC